MGLSLPPSRAVGLAAIGAAIGCSAIATWSSLTYYTKQLPEAAIGFLGGPLVQAWVRWDSGWYASIARDGYWYSPGMQTPVAFFPGYPLLIRALMQLGLNPYAAGFLVTLCSGLLAIWLFFRWASTLTDSKTARAASLLLVLYPFALYLYGAVYSDALLLALVVGAFLCLERDRIVWAAVLGMLATATRPIAPAVVLGLVIRQVERRRQRGEPIRALDFLPLLSLCGLGLYMAYQWRRFGDPLAFVHVQSAPGWDQPPGLETWFKFTWFRILFPRVAPLVAIRLVGHALITLGALALALPTRRLLGWGYAFYVAAAVGLPAVASKDFMGLGRYVLAAFPLFLTLAMWMRDRPRALKWWLTASGIILALLTFAFGAGGYVA
jgi:hypothetical protein